MQKITDLIQQSANNNKLSNQNMSDDPNEIDGGEAEEVNDEEATLADDLLDEVSADDTSDDLLEGFGVLPDAAVEEEEEVEEKDELEDDAQSLEEDAEDVDFDLFDDVDEL